MNRELSTVEEKKKKKTKKTKAPKPQLCSPELLLLSWAARRAQDGADNARGGEEERGENGERH